MDKKLPDLIVTRNGVPVEDQKAGIREFKQQCLERGEVTNPQTGLPERITPPDMKLAIRQVCPSGHLYYRESGTSTECPYCLKRRVVELEMRIEQTIPIVIGLLGGLRRGID